MRWTVDEPEDLQVIRSVVDHFGGCCNFSREQVLELTQQQPQPFVADARFARNEGANMGEGQKLWRRAAGDSWGEHASLKTCGDTHRSSGWPISPKRRVVMSGISRAVSSST